MNNVEKEFNVSLLASEDIIHINGGQCDCSDAGRSTAKAIKDFFKSWVDAFGKMVSDPHHASSMM